MRHQHFFFIFLLTLVSLGMTSCKDKRVDIGSVQYYPSFLWSDAKLTPVEKTIDCDFSQDAINDPSSFAEFQFVDNDGNPIPTNVMQVYVGGKKAIDNKIYISSKEKEVKLKIEFGSDAKSGKYQGYLKLINHQLDRLDAQPLSVGDTADALQWTISYDRQWNPLATLFLWIGIIIVSCLLLWFVILRPMAIPHFGKFTKSLLLQQNGTNIGQMSVSFKGAKKVVFYHQTIKQSMLNRVFTGKIKTVVHPAFQDKISFVPRKKGAMGLGIDYAITPNPIPRSGVATVINRKNKLTIQIR